MGINKSIAKSIPSGAKSIPSGLEENILMVIQRMPKGIYGLHVLEEINFTNRAFKIKEVTIGSLYPALKRLERQGLIKGRWGDDDLSEEQSGAARRRYYDISASGVAALQEAKAYKNKLSGNNEPVLET